MLKIYLTRNPKRENKLYEMQLNSLDLYKANLKCEKIIFFINKTLFSCLNNSISSYNNFKFSRFIISQWALIEVLSNYHPGWLHHYENFYIEFYYWWRFNTTSYFLVILQSITFRFAVYKFVDKFALIYNKNALRL